MLSRTALIRCVLIPSELKADELDAKKDASCKDGRAPLSLPAPADSGPEDAVVIKSDTDDLPVPDGKSADVEMDGKEGQTSAAIGIPPVVAGLQSEGSVAREDAGEPPGTTPGDVAADKGGMELD